MIPPLEDGVLPEGVHDCTIEELVETFGQFQRSNRRIQLAERLRDYLDEARRSGLVSAVIIDGSFVTAKDEPEDIDLIVLLDPELDWDTLRPFEYNCVSQRMIRQLRRFDVYVYQETDPRYAKMLDLFQTVRQPASYTAKLRKGVLRIQ